MFGFSVTLGLFLVRLHPCRTCILLKWKILNVEEKLKLPSSSPCFPRTISPPQQCWRELQTAQGRTFSFSGRRRDSDLCASDAELIIVSTIVSLCWSFVLGYPPSPIKVNCLTNSILLFNFVFFPVLYMSNKDWLIVFFKSIFNKCVSKKN